MSTSTSNYGWQMPDPGGSANTWGNTLNATTQAIDAQMAIAAQGGVPMGAITMFGGAAAPTDWLLCDGSSLSTAAPYDKLFAAIGYAFGGSSSGTDFWLPNLQEVYPLGAEHATDNASVGSPGGQWDYTLNVADLPPHTHAIVDVAHNHGVNQWAHAHNIATNGHNHVLLHDPSHTHTYATLGGGVNIQPGSRRQHEQHRQHGRGCNRHND